MMQYFTIVAYIGQRAQGRACAMISAASLKNAAEKAGHLVRSDHLKFVEHGSKYAIRASSRRETSLLQSYLASCNGAHLETYVAEDLDSLLWRRGSQLLSFFMLLYLAPETLHRRFHINPGGGGGTDGGGSGGRALQEGEATSDGNAIMEVSVDSSEVDTGEVTTSQDAQGDHLEQDDSQNASSDIEQPLDDSSHLEVLEGIMGSTDDDARSDDDDAIL